MPVEELTSSIDRYQSAHSAAGVPRAFAIGVPARPVRPQTFGVRPQSFGARPQSYGVRICRSYIDTVHWQLSANRNASYK